MNCKSITRLLLVLSLISPFVLSAQIERINATIPQNEAETHLRFLASDEMRGRNTGSIELNIAGRYIAEQFRKCGLTPLGDQEGDYLQKLPLFSVNPPKQAKVSLLGEEYTLGEDLAVLTKVDAELDAPIVYLTDLNSFKAEDVQGKIVLSVIRDVRSSFRNGAVIAKLKEAGAVAMIEIYSIGQAMGWNRISGFFNGPQMEVDTGSDESPLPRVWVEDIDRTLIEKLNQNSNGEAKVSIAGANKSAIRTFNIVGKIEGTDPELKKEHIIMCAHYDHVGVRKGEGQDSIYNGTRDNGIGTTGLINAAHYFGKYPTKRSIIIIALTGEEKGLLGSRYYANNPKIPLEETVFAFNIDNSGYTTTDVLTLLDTARTNIDELVIQAASEVGLGVIGDRLPSQNYYERSDQVSFAEKGVPAVNFKMSMTAFDERISDFYHQPSDEVKNVDLEYIYKYWRAYIRSAELLGNWNQRPYWIKGDKFEPAGDALYKK